MDASSLDFDGRRAALVPSQSCTLLVLSAHAKHSSILRYTVVDSTAACCDHLGSHHPRCIGRQWYLPPGYVHDIEETYWSCFACSNAPVPAVNTHASQPNYNLIGSPCINGYRGSRGLQPTYRTCFNLTAALRIPNDIRLHD